MTNIFEELNARTATRNAFAKKGMYTADDIALWQPRLFRDYRTPYTTLSVEQDGVYAAFTGIFTSADEREGKRKYAILRVKMEDGALLKVMLFGNLYLYEHHEHMLGLHVTVCGRLKYDPTYKFTISNPDWMGPSTEFRPRIERIYPKVGGVSEATFKKYLSQAVYMSEDPLEEEVRSEYHLPDYKKSLWNIHYGENYWRIEQGQFRVLFNNLLYFSIALQSGVNGIETSGISFPEFKKTVSFLNSLPFELTIDQKQAINQIVKSSRSGKRMNALLQGDVGCGKTLVAVSFMMIAWENGYQAMLMAPREALAEQHYREICEYAEKMGISCIFLHSGMKKKERDAALEGIRTGSIDFIIGTHSCVSEAVMYARLGAVITDEEHLFGVAQKEALQKKTAEGIHTLSMSATPIPRSMASVLYSGQQQMITIKSMPAGRKPVKTGIQPSHDRIFSFIEKEVQAGHQCYVVCPAIDEDEDTGISSVEEISRMYISRFGKKAVGIVHGRMKREEIENTIGCFSKGKAPILISTTVIEVGINVPTATVMVIEQAERYGLASLHQLRGRVGRSDLQSYCVLVSEDTQNPRLKTMCETTDGFVIAEEDMKQRGMGNLIGLEQSGKNKFLKQALDYPEIFRKARECARYCLDNGYGTELVSMYEHAGAS